MSSTVSKLVIVGNGLDLHHDLATSYRDFVNSGLKEDSLKKLRDYAKLANYDLNKENWYDFEELFRRVILIYRENNGKSGGLSNENSQNFAIEIEKVNKFFHGLMHELQAYLRGINKNNSNFKVDNNVAPILNSSDIVLTFNYTDTIENLYGIDKKKIIHVHGNLEDFPIFGHSNFIQYNTETADYGFTYSMQGLAEQMNSGNVQTLKFQTGQWIEPNNPPKPVRQVTNISNVMFGDKNMQRLIMMAHTEKKNDNSNFLSVTALNSIYENPFSDFPKEVGLSNSLKLDFENHLLITIIGHGLQSDMDLLCKIKSDNKLIQIFNGPNFYDKSLQSRAENIFNVDKENIVIKEYSW